MVTGELHHDPIELVDPELRAVLAALPDLHGLDSTSLPAVRELLSGSSDLPVTPGLTVDWVDLPRSSGQPGVPALLYRPDSPARRPAILNLHGGGFVSGSALREDAGMRSLAMAVDAVILSIGYRLAPETAYPGPLDDCYLALEWLHANADRLGVDPDRIAVRGVSAGGGLAAGLGLLARDRQGPPIAFQMLVYPMLDDRTGPHPFCGQYVWPAEANRFAWGCYLGDLAGSQAVPAYAAPARADDLAGLPPTFIATGAIDLFAEEDIEFARALIRAGVPTELHVYPGAYHGFILIDSAAVAKSFQQDSRRALSRALGVEKRAHDQAHV